MKLLILIFEFLNLFLSVSKALLLGLLDLLLLLLLSILNEVISVLDCLA